MRAIAQDLKPVRPSPQPLQLALRMVPLALLVSSLILLAIGPRHDAGILGPLLTWGASAVQFVLAIALVWIAAHESTPAGKLPRQVVYSAVIAASLLVVLVTLLTFLKRAASEPVLRVPPVANELRRVKPWLMGFVCGIGSMLAAGILALFFNWCFETRSPPGQR